MINHLPYFISRKDNEGQAVLIVLLTVAVILTIGLSIASRSVTDIKMSQQTEESARVFWVAQAGLEQAIKASSGVASSDNPLEISNISYFVSKSIIGGSTTYLFNDTTTGKVGADEVKYLWLVEHNSDGGIDTSVRYTGQNVKIYWGEGSWKPAISVDLIYLKDAVFYSKRYAFDTQVRSPQTKFDNAICDVGEYACHATLDFSGLPSGSELYLLVLRTYYLNSGVTIPLMVEAESGQTIPSQGNCYESSASHETSNISRKLKECRTWSQPTQLGYLLFSGLGGLEK